jgi:hypothetical protein
MGSHAKTEKGQHTLVSVQEYFKTVMDEITIVQLINIDKSAIKPT